MTHEFRAAAVTAILIILAVNPSPATGQRGVVRAPARALARGPAQALDLTGGRATAARFDAGSRQASLTFALAARSIVRLSVDFPAAWQQPAAACGISGLEFTSDPEMPCAEFVDVAAVGADWTYEPDFVTRDRRASRARMMFTLEPGRYRLQLTARQNRSPTTPLPRAFVARPPTVSVTEAAASPVPDELLALDAWLDHTPLADKLDVLHVFSRADALGRDLPPDLQRDYARRLAEAGEMRANVGRRGARPPGEAPTVLIHMRAKMPRAELSAVERAFEAEAGISLWLRVFQRINLAGYFQASRVMIWMPVPCTGGIIYQNGPGDVSRHGPSCQMATAAADIPPGLSGDVMTGGTASSTAPEVDLAEVVGAFLPVHFSPDVPRLEYLARTPSYVEVLVKDLRGKVIDGGSAWERIQISVVLSDIGGVRQLRVFVDGRLSSGLGGYPPDTQFTTDMEPDHAESLNVFAGALVVALRDYIAGGR